MSEREGDPSPDDAEPGDDRDADVQQPEGPPEIVDAALDELATPSDETNEG